jgi:hypothetical protein
MQWCLICGVPGRKNAGESRLGACCEETVYVVIRFWHLLPTAVTDMLSAVAYYAANIGIVWPPGKPI